MIQIGSSFPVLIKEVDCDIIPHTVNLIYRLRTEPFQGEVLNRSQKVYGSMGSSLSQFVGLLASSSFATVSMPYMALLLDSASVLQTQQYCKSDIFIVGYRYNEH